MQGDLTFLKLLQEGMLQCPNYEGKESEGKGNEHQ